MQPHDVAMNATMNNEYFVIRSSNMPNNEMRIKRSKKSINNAEKRKVNSGKKIIVVQQFIIV